MDQFPDDFNLSLLPTPDCKTNIIRNESPSINIQRAYINKRVREAISRGLERVEIYIPESMSELDCYTLISEIRQRFRNRVFCMRLIRGEWEYMPILSEQDTPISHQYRIQLFDSATCLVVRTE